MREGTTSRVMAADRPFGEFYHFYSVRPEYSGYTLVHHLLCILLTKCAQYDLITTSFN
jgi:hypothetical protein